MSSSSAEAVAAPAAARREVVPLSAATYRRHPLHGEDRVWPETNCYTDLLIEMVHGLGHEPLAMLGCTVAVDFEGDQWTFFKPPLAHLEGLYGLDIQELAIWRGVLDHVVEQVGAGRIVLAELDSWYLPDTSGSAYRLQHLKTTVGVNAIDVERRSMGYFHNAGYYELEGDDFEELFLLRGKPHERVLPPYVEFVKRLPGFAALAPAELARRALGYLPSHVARMPRANPFTAFRARFADELPDLLARDLSHFHAYSFATLRQFGACYGLAEAHLRWLVAQGIGGVAEPAEAFGQIAQGAKAFQFQLARAMARKKPLDLAPLEAMGESWSRAAASLARAAG